MNRSPFVLYILVTVGIFCGKPTEPVSFFEPKTVTMHLLFKNSMGMIQPTASLTDTVGKTVYIGAVAGLYKYIDSVNIFIRGVNLIEPDQDTVKHFLHFKSDTDTLWSAVTMATSGVRTVTAITYIVTDTTFTKTGQITMVSK